MTVSEPRTAILFPGQGSQTATMRDDVARYRPDLLAFASEVVGEDPFARVEDGTRWAQPAIYCASVVGWQHLQQAGIEAAAFTGHSLGEIAALVAAGIMLEDDGLRLAATRGRLMQESGERSGGGSMLALVGTGAAEHAAQVAAGAGLTVANDNAPNQVVLAGAHDGFDAAVRAASALGLRARPLAVAGAFHSCAMAAARPELEAALAAIELRDSNVLVISSITSEPFDDVRVRLADALTRPVRWRETLLALRGHGIERFAETGPGRVLSSLVKRTLPGAEVLVPSAESPSMRSR